MKKWFQPTKWLKKWQKNRLKKSLWPKKKPKRPQQPSRTILKNQVLLPTAKEDASKAQALLDGKADAATGRFIVQAGAFSEAAKVREVRRKLEQAGFKTYNPSGRKRRQKQHPNPRRPFPLA